MTAAKDTEMQWMDSLAAYKLCSKNWLSHFSNPARCLEKAELIHKSQDFLVPQVLARSGGLDWSLMMITVGAIFVHDRQTVPM